MLGDIGAEIDEKSYLLIALPAWAIKLKDRDDFEEILDHQVGEFTIRQYLVMDVYFEAGQASLVTYDMFELVGLDPEEGIDELEALLAGPGDLPEFNPGQVEEAKIRLATRRREIEETPTLAADAKARVDEALEDTGDL